MSTPHQPSPEPQARRASQLPDDVPVHDDPERHLPEHHNPLPELDGPHAYVVDDAKLAAVQASDEFQELKKRFRNFAFPLSAAFLIWYFAYVLLSTYAVGFMSRPLFGNVTIGLFLGLLQFLTTFVITALYIRHANKNLDPIATKIRAQLEGTR
ncbi:uncharacterized membrane protein (DUF485 family) [Luteococcus japonicus]|uniref:Uncharacterized membrane protein (DUF485 family) n=1 Tax=Luteococcus japonicus TaxID=33984 RepID=A0A3N1ZSI1_9ACTN|nr:DUF485 domain-containing protein [Luteococcus japonicus]ROR53799.1 uncharacterized membrane protein (DUF485 family) [Luteococcus japonicus]